MESEAPKPVNQMANASWIVGLVGFFIYLFVYGILGLFIGIVAVVLAIVGFVQINKTGEGGKGRAIIGIILGVLPLVCFGTALILAPTIGNVFEEIINNLDTMP